MKCLCENEKWQAFGLLALRVALGLILVVHGYAKITGIDATAGFFDGIGIPLPTFSAWLVGLLEFIGGIALIIGFHVKTVASLLAVELVIALLVVHVGAPWAKAELAVAVLGGLLALHGTGGGKWRVVKTECACSLMKGNKK